MRYAHYSAPTRQTDGRLVTDLAVQSSSLHSKLWTIRFGKQMTQQELAQLAGVSRKTINAIEVGKSWPSLLVALKIAKALQMPVETIFSLR